MADKNNALELLRATIHRHLTHNTDPESLAGKVPHNRGQLDVILSDAKRLSYRDGLLVQLAYALVDPETDTTRRPVGARTVCQQLGEFLAENHIRAVKDAYQNIAKNTDVLNRGNFKEFDDFLVWANSARQEERRACFNYACCAVARTARPVRPLPSVDLTGLRFAALVRLYHRMLSIPSEGVYEQFIVASLLYALAQQRGTGEYVETKPVNASDKSSGTAGDVQVKSGSRVLEAYEITGAQWQGKVQGVIVKLKEYDLSRIHIVAPLTTQERDDIAELLGKHPEDISVLDSWVHFGYGLGTSQAVPEACARKPA